MVDFFDMCGDIINIVVDFFNNTFKVITDITNFIKDFIFGMFDFLPNELKVIMLVLLPILIAIFIYRFIR